MYIESRKLLSFFTLFFLEVANIKVLLSMFVRSYGNIILVDVCEVL